jgi:hypothetical protein
MISMEKRSADGKIVRMLLDNIMIIAEDKQAAYVFSHSTPTEKLNEVYEILTQ